MQTIIKLESRVEVQKNGAKVTIYRRTLINPTDPEYPEELKKQQAFLEQKSKGKFFNANQRPR